MSPGVMGTLCNSGSKRSKTRSGAANRKAPAFTAGDGLAHENVGVSRETPT